MNTTTTTQAANPWAVQPSQGGDFEKAPVGNHPAVLVALIDLGTQWQDGYQGEPGKWQRRVYWCWELVTKRLSGTKGRNHVLGMDLTLSTHEKAKMRKIIESRSGRKVPDGVPYDISTELGKPCLLNVILKGQYPQIDGVSAVPDGMVVPSPTYKPVAVSLRDHEEAGSPVVADWLPWLFGRKLGDVVMDCREIAGDGEHGRGRKGGASSSAAGDDESSSSAADDESIPF